MTTIKYPVLAASLLAASVASSHAASVSLDFSTSAQYDNNFVESLNPANIAHNATNQNVLYNPVGDNGTSIARYDTNPGNGAYDTPAFLTETISAAFTFPDITANQSAGIITRIQTTGTAIDTGVLALINTNAAAGSSVQIRLFYGAKTIADSTAGTAFYNTTFNLTNTTSTGDGGTSSTNTITSGTPVLFTLTQTSGVDPVFNFTLSDSGGLIATTGNRTLTATDDFNNGGAVAIRLNSGLAGKTITMDDFSIVPEPSTALLGVLGTLTLLRRRR